jgi:hypothetical protein
MKFLIAGLAIAILVVAAAAVIMTQQPNVSECDTLAKNFDSNNVNQFSVPECQRSNASVWVGGTLVNIARVQSDFPKRYEYRLLFKGDRKYGTITIGNANDTIPYQAGKFYKFDLRNKCVLILSAESSGMFYDPNLNALTPMDCK